MNDRSDVNPPLRILWTVDVEDYYMSPESIPVSTWDEGRFEDRIEIGCRKLLEIFADSGVKATWFFLGWVAEKHPELVRAALQAGHEIATHTYDHRPVHSLSLQEFTDSLDRSCAILKSIAGREIRGLRAPEWSIRSGRREVFEARCQRGFLYDSSLNPVATYLFGERGLPRFPYLKRERPPLWEIPPAAIRIAGKDWPVGGGFFLRALPLTYLCWAIRRYNNEGYPAVVYLHPWELDPDHPIPEMSFKERRIHLMGLRSTERKVRALASGCQSQSMEEFVRQTLTNSARS
jgi:polysaccharide deacetylase family protein (PEP-CTERM system associated)